MANTRCFHEHSDNSTCSVVAPFWSKISLVKEGKLQWKHTRIYFPKSLYSSTLKIFCQFFINVQTSWDRSAGLSEESWRHKGAQNIFLLEEILWEFVCCFLRENPHRTNSLSNDQKIYMIYMKPYVFFLQRVFHWPVNQAGKTTGAIEKGSHFEDVSQLSHTWSIHNISVTWFMSPTGVWHKTLNTSSIKSNLISSWFYYSNLDYIVLNLPVQ